MFVEEPTNQDTIDPTLRLKRDFPDVKIALGERFITRWDFRPWFEQQAIDVCQADPSHCGGISELVKIAHFAEVCGIRGDLDGQRGLVSCDKLKRMLGWRPKNHWRAMAAESLSQGFPTQMPIR